MNTASNTPAHTIDAVLAYFENLSPQSLSQLNRYYAPQARFKDPFNGVTGLAEITRIFAHMFVSLVEPRFVITERVSRTVAEQNAAKLAEVKAQVDEVLKTIKTVPASTPVPVTSASPSPSAKKIKLGW